MQIGQSTDYGHTMARFLILCGPYSNILANEYLGCDITFCRSNSWLMENSGTYCIKMGADNSAENTPKAQKLPVEIVGSSQKVLDLDEKKGFIVCP